jgi:hypothetical protein
LIAWPLVPCRPKNIEASGGALVTANTGHAYEDLIEWLGKSAYSAVDKATEDEDWDF